MNYFPIIFLAFSLINAQQNLNSLPFRSYEERKLFAGYLFCNADYLRAAEEYEAIYSANPNDTILFYSIVSYFRTGDFLKGNTLVSLLTNNTLQLRAFEEKYRALFSQEQYSLLSEELEKDVTFLKDTEVSRYELFYLIRHRTHFVLEGNMMPWLSKEDRDSLSYFAMLKNSASTRSPWIAAILSAILPGSGKIYTGFVSDGLTALAINSLFVYLSIANFQAKHNMRGYIFGCAAAFFYAGNIYGSAASAHIYNASVQFTINSAFDTFLSQNNYLDRGETVTPCGSK